MINDGLLPIWIVPPLFIQNSGQGWKWRKNNSTMTLRTLRGFFVTLICKKNHRRILKYIAALNTTTMYSLIVTDVHWFIVSASPPRVEAYISWGHIHEQGYPLSVWFIFLQLLFDSLNRQHVPCLPIGFHEGESSVPPAFFAQILVMYQLF